MKLIPPLVLAGMLVGCGAPDRPTSNDAMANAYDPTTGTSIDRRDARESAPEVETEEAEETSLLDVNVSYAGPIEGRLTVAVFPGKHSDGEASFDGASVAHIHVEQAGLFCLFCLHFGGRLTRITSIDRCSSRRVVCVRHGVVRGRSVRRTTADKHASENQGGDELHDGAPLCVLVASVALEIEADHQALLIAYRTSEGSIWAESELSVGDGKLTAQVQAVLDNAILKIDRHGAALPTNDHVSTNGHGARSSLATGATCCGERDVLEALTVELILSQHVAPDLIAL